jgi:hypothetical protein
MVDCRNVVRFLAVALMAVLSGGSLAQAPQPVGVPVFSIAEINSGWWDDVFRVVLDAPVQNSHGCAAADSYMVEKDDPGRRAHQAMLISSFMAGKKIYVIIQGCHSHGRPKIIGVHVQRQ